MIIAGTKAAKEEINKEIREQLKAKGKLTDETEYQMVKSDEDGIEHPKNIKLAKGDIISFTRNDYEKYDIRNGEKAEILNLSKRIIKVVTEDKRILDINVSEYKNIDYGYALTTYKSQGQTYNKVVIESDTAVPVLSDMRNQYVNITRARDSVKIFTDDIEDLKELAEVKTHARDTIGMEREPIFQKVVEKDEVKVYNDYVINKMQDTLKDFGPDNPFGKSMLKELEQQKIEAKKTEKRLNERTDLTTQEKTDIAKVLNNEKNTSIWKYPDITTADEKIGIAQIYLAPQRKKEILNSFEENRRQLIQSKENKLHNEKNQGYER